MKYFICLLSIIVFIKTFSYAIYEYKEKNNKSAGILVIILDFFALLLPNLVIWVL